MSPKLRRLSGKEVVKIFENFHFRVVSQRGSHVKLRRKGPQGEKQILTIPLHDELDKGTLRAILRQASEYVDVEELKKFFYTE